MNKFRHNPQNNNQRGNYRHFEKNLVPGPRGPIDKSKKIQEKNTAKGQHSLSSFLGSHNYTGVTANRAAYEHYAVQSNSYNNINGRQPVPDSEEQMLSEGHQREDSSNEQSTGAVPPVPPAPVKPTSANGSQQSSNNKTPKPQLKPLLAPRVTQIVKQPQLTQESQESKLDLTKLQLWSWNVNGIRAILKKSRIQEFFETAQPTVLAVQESKIDDERMSAERLKDNFPPSYLQYWNCCKPPIKGYAGTIIFSKLKPVDVKFDIGVHKHDKEGRTITLEYEKFFLVGVYVPNSGATLKWQEYRTNEWDLDFRAYLKGLERRGKPVILCGDMNVAHQDIDIFDPKRNEKMACFTKEERQSFSNFTKMGFVDTFRELYPGKIKYSFWDIRDKSRKENKGWRLDYFLVSKGMLNAVVDAEIHNEFWGSDHCPVSLTIDVTKIDLKEFRESLRLAELDDQLREGTESGEQLDMDDPLNDGRKSDLEEDDDDEDENGVKYHMDDDEGEGDEEGSQENPEENEG